MSRLMDVLARMTPFSSTDEALQLVCERWGDRPMVIGFVNQHALNMAIGDPEFYRHLLRCDLLLRDGRGTEMACQVLGRDAGANLNGTDLIPALLEQYRGQRIALFGTAEPWLDKAVKALRKQGLDVVAAIDGFQKETVYEDAVVAARPDIIVLAMGMPRQEAVAAHLAGAINSSVLIINGGAILDFIAGRTPRAPLWMRRVGLEWLYRLSREPHRLAGRYVLGIPVFAARVLRERFAGARIKAAA
jgi:exopolysaccharide biosynthesis WecB/TagA/CpsF family protein